MRYVIGDIHGGSGTFSALLDQLNLQYDDRIYLLGDYIDRGPDSKGVLDIILPADGDGYDVRHILGNHEISADVTLHVCCGLA
jgi:serine/threonine protein phosphatase 1